MLYASRVTTLFKVRIHFEELEELASVLSTFSLVFSVSEDDLLTLDFVDDVSLQSPATA